MQSNLPRGATAESAPAGPADTASILRQALAFHQAGYLTEAEQLYRRILQTQPRHFDSLHLLGVIHHHRGEHGEAVRQIDLALKINPGFAAAHNNRGIALKELSRFDEALACYDKAIAIDHNFADAHNNRGVVLYELGRFSEALTAFDRAVWLKPDYAEACNNRGNTLKELKQFEDALKSYDRAIGLRQNFAVAYNNRGSVLRELGRIEEALASYDAAIAHNPDDASAFNNRGVIFAKLERFEEALADFDRALSLGLNDTDVFYDRGNALEGLGRFEEALASYDRAIALKPDDTKAFNNRGIALVALNRFDEAIESYENAIRLKADDAVAFGNRGLALLELKRFEAALEDFDRAIELQPDDADGYFNKGTALKNAKRFDEALATFDQAIAIEADHAEALNSRGIVLAELNRFDEAIESYNRAIALKLDYYEAFNNRGVANKLLKQFDEALASYDRAIALKPDHAESFNNRGNVLKELRRFDEALASYDRALALKPDYAEAFNNGGMVLNDLRQYDRALGAYGRAIALKSDFAEAYVNRGVVLNNLGRFDEALRSFGRGIELKPDYAEAFYNRGNTLNNLKRFDEAVADSERAIALKPDQKYVEGLRLHAKMHNCSWSNLEGDSSHLASSLAGGLCASQPFSLLPAPIGPETQQKCAELFLADRLPVPPEPLWRGERYGHDRIRVGYVSGDMREHPVSVLMAGLFEQHDKSRFETVAISLGGGSQDAMSERLKAAFEHFIDVRGKSDREIASLLRSMEIDIAVDLNGFTGDARPAIFAERPAPVQVNYLGFAGTLGRNYWDYIVADRFVIPEDRQGDFAEQVAYLPGSFMATDNGRKISARIPSRKEAGLPERGFVFCCFNNSYKLTPDAFDIWMRLLKEVEGSVLWLSAPPASAMGNLRAEAEKRGISADRLVFAQRVASNEDHLARLKLADLFLDTLYYNAHTTACDALWAGLPLVTTPGQTFASRVAGGLLHAIGCPELIAPSQQDYEALALKLARDPAQLAAIKAKLAAHRDTHALFDTARFTRQIEAAYTTMWQRAQQGEKPKSFDVV